MILPHVTIIALYRSPKVPSAQLKQVLLHFLDVFAPQPCIFIGDFNVNWFNETQRIPLFDLCGRYNLRQIVSYPTTNRRTCIDHIYTNIPESQVQTYPLETYFTDHKAVTALINCFSDT